jgi:hypothetical protein
MFTVLYSSVYSFIHSFIHLSLLLYAYRTCFLYPTICNGVEDMWSLIRELTYAQWKNLLAATSSSSSSAITSTVMPASTTTTTTTKVSSRTSRRTIKSMVKALKRVANFQGSSSSFYYLYV